MYLQKLPNPCVALLDALFLKSGQLLEEALEHFQQERQAFLDWIDLHGAVVDGAIENAGFENLRALWLELDLLLVEPQQEALMEKLYQLYGLRAELQRERWRRGFCRDEVVNGALLAAEQVLCRGLSFQLLEAWNLPLRDYLRSGWERALESGSLALDEPGFRAFEQGLQGWDAATSSAGLEESMRWLAWGCNQMEAFLGQLQPGWLAVELGSAPTAEYLDRIYLEFQADWDRQLWPSTRRAQLCDELEERLFQLETAGDAQGWGAAQCGLGELWRETRPDTQVSRPEGLAEGLMFDALLGHLEGSVPRLVLARMGQDFPGSARVRRELLLYLYNHQLEALDRLADVLLEPVEAVTFSLALVA